MDHVAILKKSWGLSKKILSGEKTIESRWYKTKYVPWDKIKPGDNVYFKDSGEPVSIRVRVTKVLQFGNLNSKKTRQILRKYAKSNLGIGHIMPQIKRYVYGKNYCVLIFFDSVKKIRPFHVIRRGFGLRAAWITIGDIESIKKEGL